MIWEDSHDIGGDLAADQNVCTSDLALKVTTAGKLNVTIRIITITENVR
ncbi:hypothetical protein ES703_124782 [subsurface metagenome]